MILNRQRRVPISIYKLEKFFARACRAVRLPTESLAISLVTNAQIARWNRAYRGKSGPTDVLSFPANEVSSSRQRTSTRRRRRYSSPLSATPYLGDIAIAPSVARRNARRFGRTFDDEMRILVLHGILHLMGYDHETDSGQMDRLEARLRRSLGLT